MRWPITSQHREQVVNVLMDMIRSGDPEQVDRAVMLLLRADRVNLDAEREKRRAGKDEADRRQRLLELASTLPPGELRTLIQTRFNLTTSMETQTDAK